MGESELTMDQLRERSLALRDFHEQRARIEGERRPGRREIEELTGHDRGPAVYDLVAIWRASLEDPDCRHISQGLGKTSPQARRYMSPRRYLNGWPHLVTALEEPGDGRILVDGYAAWDYCMKADARVMVAAFDRMIESRKAAAAADPLGSEVDAARGGPFAMMFARMDAQHLGLSDREFDEAVLERANREAQHLDVYAAEKLLSEVRQALEGCPKIEVIEG